MMTPWPLLKDDAQVKIHFGQVPRVSSFGKAKEFEDQYPYGTWQLISGTPYNNLNGPSTMEAWTWQFDVWGKSDAQVTDAAMALRDALEKHGYITFWRGTSIDPETKSYRFSFDFQAFQRYLSGNAREQP